MQGLPDCAPGILTSRKNFLSSAECPEPVQILDVDSEIYSGTLDCVHCGLCLTACPTYRITGREASSPRGRVHLMRGVAEGEIELSQTVADELHLCLGCRACETKCPSGVQYGALLEQGRAIVAQSGLRKGLGFRVEEFALRHILAHKGRLKALVSLLGWVQRLRLDRLAAPFLPAGLSRARRLLPEIPASAERERLPTFTPAKSPRRGRVAFLEGCVMPELFGRINRASVRVLAANGFDVWVPPDQVCCGALHAHSGDLESARSLARQNERAFGEEDPEGFDALVTNSAGCGAALREVDHWLPEGSDALEGKVRDVTEFLDEVGWREPLRSLSARVCYDDPCHLVHAQGVAAAPRRLLGLIPDLELVPHANADRCCGAAGTYNLLQAQMADSVLEKKLEDLEVASPEWILTGNPGCLMQLQAGVASRGWKTEVAHPIELLDQALGSDESA